MRIHVRMTLYINTGNSVFLLCGLFGSGSKADHQLSSLGALTRVWSSQVAGVGSSLFYFPLIFCALYTFSTLLGNRHLNHNFPDARDCLSHYQIGLQHSFVDSGTVLLFRPGWNALAGRAWLSVQDCQLPGALGTHLVKMFLLWQRRICQSFWNRLSLHQMCYSMGKFTFEKPLRKNTDEPKALLHPLTSHFFLLSLVSFSGRLILCMCSWGNLPLAKTFNDPEFLMLTLNQFLQMLLISFLIFSQCCSLQLGEVFSLVLRKCLSDLQVKLLKNDI